jgi:hypothetical protein
MNCRNSERRRTLFSPEKNPGAAREIPSRKRRGDPPQPIRHRRAPRATGAFVHASGPRRQTCRPHYETSGDDAQLRDSTAFFGIDKLKGN